MKNKILIFLLICAGGLFWDDIAMRIYYLENDSKDNLSRRSRLSIVENKVERISDLDDRLKNLEKELADLNSIKANNFFLLQRMALYDQIFEKKFLDENGIRVFRTSQRLDRSRIVSIGSGPLYERVNWGSLPYFKLGSITPEAIFRTLIKFEELDPEVFKNKKILAALLYIQQRFNDAWMEDDAAMNEVIDLYAVRKEWYQGKGFRGDAAQGEVSWLSARTGQDDWSAPGCSDQTEDVDPLLMGTSGPVVSGDSTGWVVINLNNDGIKRLQDVSWPNNGYLLKMRDETRANTNVFFESAKSSFKENSPYMEIYYMDKDVAIEKTESPE